MNVRRRAWGGAGGHLRSAPALGGSDPYSLHAELGALDARWRPRRMWTRLSNMVVFYPMRLRARLVHELFTLIGIAVGVALMFDSQIVRASSESTELFSVIGTMVGFLFALNAVLLTAPQRRKLVEDLRLDGYGRGMIVQLLLFDALLLGVLASLVGLALGALLSTMLFSSGAGSPVLALPIDAQRTVSWQSVALGAGGGLLAALAGVLVSVRRAIRECAVLGPVYTGGGSTGGLVVVLGELAYWTIALVTLLAVPGAAVVGVVSLVLALLLAVPWLVRACLRAADGVRRSSSSTAVHLAALELRSSANWSRTLAIAATGATAVFGSVAIGGAQGNLQHGLDRIAHDLAASADVWVSPADSQSVLATNSLPSAELRLLRRLPDVRDVALVRSSVFDSYAQRVWAIALPGSISSRFSPGQSASGASAAGATHQRPGGGVSAYGIVLRRGVSPRRGRREVQRALAAGGDRLAVETRAESERRLQAASRGVLARLTQITSLVLIAAILAMATAMGAMIWQRRPLLADMKVDGFSRGLLWRSLLMESALILAVSCSIGAMFGLAGQLLLSHALAAVTDCPVGWSVDALGTIGSLLAVVSAAVAIVAVPGYLATRTRAAVALQE